MTNHIPFNRPFLSKIEIDLMERCINQGHLSGNGTFTKQVESEIEALLGVDRCLLTSSCTHALEMSAILLNLVPGDEVILPSFTFVSTANAFLMNGANLVFVDCDAKTKSITPATVKAALSQRTRAVCVVHYGGVSTEVDELAMLCEQNGIVLIEDNAHGLFGTYKGQQLGTFGSISTLSFHETKNFTCGEGGALLLNDPSLIQRAEILREKGTNRSQFLNGQVDKYTWVDIGSSWVLSDLQAAILLGQLRRRDEIQERRAQIYNAYATSLKTWAHLNNVDLPYCPPESIHSSHLFYLQFGSELVRHLFIKHMKLLDISVVFHYQSLHSSPFGRQNSIAVGDMKNTVDASNGLVRLPIHFGMTDRDVERVIEAVIRFRT